jgi:hypothetical protein
MFNQSTKETHWYLDECCVMREKSDADHNKHDSAETTYHAYCAYKDSMLTTSAQICLACRPPRRYPVPYAGMQPMSRDHVIYNLCNIMERGISVGVLKVFIPPIIFDKGKGSYMNLQMWLWTRMIVDNKIGFLFYPVALLQAVKNSLWNRLLNFVFGYDNTELSVYMHNAWINKHNSKKASLYYPVYAIKLVATMLQYVPKNWFSRQIKKQLLRITPTSNFALRIMLGDRTVKKHDVSSFRPIDKPRWSQIINPYRNKRFFRYLTDREMEFNCVDKDYLMYLWSNRELFYE